MVFGPAEGRGWQAATRVYVGITCFIAYTMSVADENSDQALIYEMVFELWQKRACDLDLGVLEKDWVFWSLYYDVDVNHDESQSN
jgi:hypothetical protein